MCQKSSKWLKVFEGIHMNAISVTQPIGSQTSFDRKRLCKPVVKATNISNQQQLTQLTSKQSTFHTKTNQCQSTSKETTTHPKQIIHILISYSFTVICVQA